MDDDEESTTSSNTTENISNGGTTNAIHDRSRLTNTSAPPVNGGSSTTVGRHHQPHQSQPTKNSASSTSSQHHHHHPNSSGRSDGDRTSSTSSSTSTAKESFLNYFFGQNGPGSVAGANITNMPSEVYGHLIRRREAVGNAFMRMRNGPTRDGSDAAFDMKSLGKHIEAVSLNFPSFPFGVSVGGGYWTSSPTSCGSLYPLRSHRRRVMDLRGAANLQGLCILPNITIQPGPVIYCDLNAGLIPFLLFLACTFYLLLCGSLARNAANVTSFPSSSSSDLASKPQRRNGDQLDPVAHHVVFRHR